MAIPLTVRKGLYEELAYYEARANAALVAGNLKAHLAWGKRYHSLKRLLAN